MRYSIENEMIKIEVESLGAELKSVIDKKTGQEYMWCANPDFWGRTSPVLFPFVGSLNGDKYIFEGNEYKMSQHGFARDSEFELVEKTKDSIWFRLKDSDKTYENYPFHFCLECGYVISENKVDVKWRVSNPGQDRADENLYFSIGAHPAFACPINGEKDKTGYKLIFHNADKIYHHGNLTGTCTHENLCLELENGRAYITEDFFDRSTYIIEEKQLKCISIETPEGKEFVKVQFDTPLVAVWSPTNKKRAPFICIEPWCGRADYDDYCGDLINREYSNTLSKGKIFESGYTMSFM